MKVSGSRPMLAMIATVLALGCEGRGTLTEPDEPDVRFARPTCPGHPSCGDPAPPGGATTADLTGDVTTASAQPVVVSKDSRNQLAGSGALEESSIVDALSFFVSAGSPTPTALNGCVTDPPDLASTDPATVQRLINRLTDASQSRTFRFTVNRKDPANMTGGINQSWTDDGDGRGYRTRVSSATVTSPSTDVYVYTQGDIVSWDTTIGEEVKLVCPNGGSVTLTLNR